MSWGSLDQRHFTWIKAKRATSFLNCFFQTFFFWRNVAYSAVLLCLATITMYPGEVSLHLPRKKVGRFHFRGTWILTMPVFSTKFYCKIYASFQYHKISYLLYWPTILNVRHKPGFQCHALCQPSCFGRRERNVSWLPLRCLLACFYLWHVNQKSIKWSCYDSLATC